MIMRNVHKILTLSVIFIISFVFYWYELRPAQIRKECQSYAWDKVKEAIQETNISDGFKDDVNFLYTNCIHKKGLKN